MQVPTNLINDLFPINHSSTANLEEQRKFQNRHVALEIIGDYYYLTLTTHSTKLKPECPQRLVIQLIGDVGESFLRKSK
jgi:hypothetical protein